MFARNAIRRFSNAGVSSANFSGSAGGAFENGLAVVGVLGFIPVILTINRFLPSDRRVTDVWVYQGSSAATASQ